MDAGKGVGKGHVLAIGRWGMEVSWVLADLLQVASEG